MRKNLYDSDKLIIIIHEEQHKYQAKFIGKCLSFSNDVCVPVPRYKHFHLLEHDGMPAMWNEWFMEDQNIWLDYGWSSNLDFAQKQGYLNTYRTEEVDTFLESKQFGVMSIRVDRVDQETLTEMCLIFPRAKIIGIKSKVKLKLKTPFGFNQFVDVDPHKVDEQEELLGKTRYDIDLQQLTHKRTQTMRNIATAIGVRLIDSECQALYDKLIANKPRYKSSGHWGRFHTVRLKIDAKDRAMLKFKVDGVVYENVKIEGVEEYYHEIIESNESTVYEIEQTDVSTSQKFNHVEIKSFVVNGQEMKYGGNFFPSPNQMVKHLYTDLERSTLQHHNWLNCEGKWTLCTNGVNILS